MRPKKRSRPLEANGLYSLEGTFKIGSRCGGSIFKLIHVVRLQGVRVDSLQRKEDRKGNFC